MTTPLLDKLRATLINRGARNLAVALESHRPNVFINHTVSDCTLLELLDAVEAKFPNIKASEINIEIGYEYSCFELIYTRKMTDEEWEEKLQREKEQKERSDANTARQRIEQYLKLKAEFKGGES